MFIFFISSLIQDALIKFGQCLIAFLMSGDAGDPSNFNHICTTVCPTPYFPEPSYTWLCGLVGTYYDYETLRNYTLVPSLFDDLNTMYTLSNLEYENCGVPRGCLGQPAITYPGGQMGWIRP